MQYKKIVIQNPTYEGSDIEEQLNKMADEGWELVTITTSMLLGTTKAYILIFKKGK